MKIKEIDQPSLAQIKLEIQASKAELSLAQNILEKMDVSSFVLEDKLLACLTIYELISFRDHLPKNFIQEKNQCTNIYENNQIIWQGHNFKFDLTQKPIIYSIINCTPDSFYDGRDDITSKSILNKIEEDLNYGASVFEFGGKSTRPGFKDVAVEDEWARISGIISDVRRAFPEITLAVDADNSYVMKHALEAGVDIINDVDGFNTGDKLEVLKEYKPAILTMYNNNYFPKQEDVKASMYDYFADSLKTFESCGLLSENIAIDPGIGYSYQTDPWEDMERIKSMKKLTRLKLPIMIALSMKSIMGKLYNIDLEDRLTASLLLESLMVQDGGRILRVHDAKATRQMLDIIQSHSVSS